MLNFFLLLSGKHTLQTHLVHYKEGWTILKMFKLLQYIKTVGYTFPFRNVFICCNPLDMFTYRLPMWLSSYIKSTRAGSGSNCQCTQYYLDWATISANSDCYHSLDFFLCGSLSCTSNAFNRRVYRFRAGPHVQWCVRSGESPPGCGLQTATGGELWHLPKPQQETERLPPEDGDRYGEKETTHRHWDFTS